MVRRRISAANAHPQWPPTAHQHLLDAACERERAVGRTGGGGDERVGVVRSLGLPMLPRPASIRVYTRLPCSYHLQPAVQELLVVAKAGRFDDRGAQVAAERVVGEDASLHSVSV